MLAHLSVNYEGRLTVGKVDTDEQQDLTARYEVSGIPAMFLFQNGEVIASRSGPCGLPELSSWVDSHIPADAPAG